jgi:hypothetical protein
MDCRGFRKQHFAYLDDTLPGDDMAAAQRHIMGCDSCAAHDSMVRRSLMLVRNMSVIEPSLEFRQRMQLRLSEARAESSREKVQLHAHAEHMTLRPGMKQPVIFTAIAVAAMFAGSFAWHERAPKEAQLLSLQPVRVTTPAIDTTHAQIVIDPSMVRAMATGNPMWPAALMVDDPPSHVMNAEFLQVKETRDLPAQQR